MTEKISEDDAKFVIREIEGGIRPFPEEDTLGMVLSNTFSHNNMHRYLLCKI